MKRIPGEAIAALIGTCAFLMIVGSATLNPQHLGWLAFGDSPTQQVGWEFFRSHPWTWPLGLNPAYGLELGGSIVYSDSIPLLAIPAKALGPLLPASFQYFGLWLLACFILQSIFAWKLLAVFTRSRVALSSGSAIFASAPVLLWRSTPAVSQWSLAGQFTILAALWLTVRSTQRSHARNWTALLATTTAIHAYLLVMVGALWVADLIQRRQRFESIRARQRALLLPTVGVLLVAWVCGYFTIVGGAGGAGYGMFKASPLAFLDPGNPVVGQWSRVIPDLPGDWLQMESFNYLGLGVLLLGAAVVIRPASYVYLRKAGRTWPWTAGAIAVLALFAFSNDWGGHYRYLHWPMPDGLAEIAAVFRASGRMLWPATYVLTAGIILLTVRTFKHRLAVPLLLLALTAQLVDTSSGWLSTAHTYRARASQPYVEPLAGEFWDRAAVRYSEIRALPLESHPAGWARIAKYAVDHGLATDVVYLARENAQSAESRRAQLARFVESGCYPSNSLFLVQPSIEAAVRLRMDTSRDRLVEVDGLLMLAPEWFKTGTCHAAQ